VPRIIDLDTVVPDDITVILHGQEYLLPGDVPVPDWLEISKATDRIDTDPAAGQELYDLVLELFRLRQPELESIPLGARQMMTLVFGLYDTDTPEEAEEEGDPPRAEEAPAGKTTSTSRKTRKARPKTGSGS
jgi:hypothetical protein